MKRPRLVFLATAVVLLLLASVQTGYSDIFTIVDQWYSDGTLNNVTGYREKDCDGNVTEWGSQSEWWSQTTTWCSSGNETYRCFHWNGSSWEQVSCYMSNGRLRIPLG